MSAGTALVTGASSGIGLELARLLAADGYDLVLVARNRARLDALAQELASAHGVRTTVIASDLAVPDAAVALTARLAALGTTVEVLVNNAGYAGSGRFSASDWPHETSMIQVNIVALTQLTKRLLPGMIARRRGRILNLASTAGFLPGPRMAVYYATKAYVLSLSEAIAHELKGNGVTVTALCPGPTRSGFQARAGVEETRLVHSPLLMEARVVARAGYRALMRGQAVVVPGVLNRLLLFSQRITPRAWVTAISAWTTDHR